MKLVLFCLCLVTTASYVAAAILGLDYGQQYTKAVLLAPGINFEMVLTDEGKRKDLSGISLRADKNDIERVYGSQTGSLCTRFPQSCILDIKPLLGKSIDDPTAKAYLTTHHGVKFVADETRNNAIKFDLGFDNQTYVFTVEEVLAMGLNEIKSRALDDLEANPAAATIAEDVVIAVPPYANQATRQAYLDALHLADFSNPLGLVDEGSTVAVNYLSNRKLEKADYNDAKEYHIVYDMGAGSTKATLFSFSAFKNGSLVLELEGIGYDEEFGGKLLSNSIYAVILEKFLIHFNLEEADVTPKIAARIAETAEKAKIILSANSEYHASLESIYDDRDFKTSITRGEFEEINSDLMGRITEPILSSLKDSGVTLDNVKSIILNGGSTRVPFIQKHLSTLVGEDRISKSVNTDESCALGSALKGLKLKTSFEKPGEIKVIEKNYNNYEYSINDESIVVFAKGSGINEKSRVNLGKLNDTVAINLYENGFLFKSYNVEDLLSKAKKLSCNSKETKEIVATFKLDNSKLFDLNKLEIECVSHEDKKGFLGNFLKKQVATEEEEEDIVESVDESNNSSSTNKTEKVVTKRAKKPITIVVPKATYPHIKPLNRTAKERLSAKLSYLNARDEQKIQMDQLRNVLEAKCYDLRNFVDDKETALLEEVSDDVISEHTKFVSETIEWLEFDSDDASVKDIEDKIKDLSDRKLKLEDIILMSETDLSISGIKKLYEDGSKIVMTIQSHMLEFGSQISEIRQKYENASFDFDKENNRIKLHLLSKGEDKMMSFDRNLAEYKKDVTTVGDLIDLPEEEFNKIPRSELYEYQNKLAKGIIEMLADILSIETSHNERIKMFNTKYDQLLKRREIKELRKKLKEEQAAAKEAKEVVEGDEEEEGGIIEEDDEEFSSVPVETATPSSETEPEPEVEEKADGDIEHDEL